MSTRNRLALTVPMLCLCVATTLFAQDSCAVGSQATGGTLFTQGTCSGKDPSEGKQGRRTFSMNAQTSCLQNNYYTEMTYSTQDVIARAECGDTGPDTPPVCLPVISDPYNQHMWLWQVFYQDARFDTVSRTCGLSAEDSEFISHPIQDCEGPICCGSSAQGACQQLNGVFNSSDCSCAYSPIIVSMGGNDLHLTSAAAGVNFDLIGHGKKGRWGWTAAGADDAFLALDRDGDGVITNGRELFGNVTEQPHSLLRHGFSALGVFDANGDKRIDQSDAVYVLLRLWFDRNHNGVSESDELVTLANAGVVALSLNYRETSRRDRFGNTFRFAAPVEVARGNSTVLRTAYDVFLTGR